MSSPTTQAAPEFHRALAELSTMSWRAGLGVAEIGSPQRIAPHGVAISGDLTEGPETLGTGRLILLHDPLGNEAWEGDFRVVTYVHADVEQEFVTDPLLPDAAWSWLTDALEGQGARHHSLAGTVTASFGQGFGQLSNRQAEVEIRASWTPVLDARYGFVPHLRAWQDLLFQISGRPPLPNGVVQFPGRS
ncbi:DUF3000 domain-containing protein [Arachnia propionica]|uniref:DUF3000 domain-containing protein n=1 Tax=Arachnia propionica TaxID=1750 RepID=UPI0021AB15D0|nr:DUF3000 domain-containing protein [Arachnia propionica]MDO5083725.1 DUF3000 domain-containing protein [Arachnia propionica]